MAGDVVDRQNALSSFFGTDVVITTACLRDTTSALTGCKLGIPLAGDDSGQLITVFPNNFDGDGDIISQLNTLGSGPNLGIEFGVNVLGTSKDIYLGLSQGQTTFDLYCTSLEASFECVKIVRCPDSQDCNVSASFTGLVALVAGGSTTNPSDFCGTLTGVLRGSYNLTRNPLAYAVTTNMTALRDEDQTGAVTIRPCSGFGAARVPAGNLANALGTVSVTTMHTQSAFVETPRTSRLRYP